MEINEDIKPGVNMKFSDLKLDPSYNYIKFCGNIYKKNGPKMKEILNALLKLQMNYFHQEMQRFKELHCLNLKFSQLYEPTFKKRYEIVNGSTVLSHKGTSKENNPNSKYSRETKNTFDLLKESTSNASSNEDNSHQGVPDFWLKVLLNSDIKDLISQEDKFILKHLTDISVRYNEEKPNSFILEFHFSPNDYFFNNTLTKEYEVRCVLNHEDPFFFDGPEYVSCNGCIIDWKNNKNNASKSLNELINEEISAPSFFNFFSNPSTFDHFDDDDIKEMMMFDFKIGQYIKEKIIPKAILFYTNEVKEEEKTLKIFHLF
ncbi:nucleosome assembly protein 1-like 1 [Centruroides sculpturatus]|uniref:nucleosome assembly protein 1-like 1 n=1 Tax=Centruroides sculpturatus TaxID=218467 RepID=UPI000C6D2586|nr:nucleosome assembly protein 1-like 1 [Centruroides sculpturatus]